MDIGKLDEFELEGSWYVNNEWLKNRLIPHPFLRKEGHTALHMSVVIDSMSHCATDNERMFIPKNVKLGRLIILGEKEDDPY